MDTKERSERKDIMSDPIDYVWLENAPDPLLAEMLLRIIKANESVADSNNNIANILIHKLMENDNITFTLDDDGGDPDE